MIDLKAIDDRNPVFALAKIARDAVDQAEGDPLKAATLAACAGLIVAHLPSGASAHRRSVMDGLEILKEEAPELLQEQIDKMFTVCLKEVNKELDS